MVQGCERTGKSPSYLSRRKQLRLMTLLTETVLTQIQFASKAAEPSSSDCPIVKFGCWHFRFVALAVTASALIDPSDQIWVLPKKFIQVFPAITHDAGLPTI